jgi:hypothetical protein
MFVYIMVLKETVQADLVIKRQKVSSDHEYAEG